MQTETLDKIYLEISQFTKAKTGKEIKLEKDVNAYKVALESIIQLEDKNLLTYARRFAEQAIRNQKKHDG